MADPSRAAAWQGRFGRGAVGAAVWLGVAIVAVPLVLTVYLSVFDETLIVFPPHAYTLRWYARILPEFGGALRTSLVTALSAAACSLLIGVPAGIGLSRYRFRGRDAVAVLMLAPLTIPGVAIGLAIFVAAVLVEERTEWAISGSVVLMVAAHVVITLPWVVRLCLASLANHDRAAEEAAASLGARPWQVVWRVTLPAMRGGIVAGGLFAFIISFENLEMTLFLTAPGLTTLPIAILQYLQYHIDPLVAAIAGGADRPGGRGVAAAGPAGAGGAGGRLSRLVLDRVSKRYGTTAAVDGVSLDIPQGELVVLLGPSGCGKTTTLRMVAGFVAASAGDILLDGRSILNLPPYKRDLGLVFQSYALFPHLTVARNVAFGLEMRGIDRAARAERVAAMLRLTRLEPLAHRLPRELSGGQQQRVALARALAIEPRVLLLDEPLSNLDAALRADVGRDIRLLQRGRGLTTVMVTHDQDEAMAMADRLVVMKDGRVQQAGTQEDLYERPLTPFVAGFIGRSTMLSGALLDGRTLVADGTPLHLAGQFAASGTCTLALRPERLSLGAPGGTGPGTAAGTVELASYLGAVREHLVRLGPDLRIVVRDTTAQPGALLAPGAAVTVQWGPGAERLFDAAETPLPSRSRMPAQPTPARMTAP